MNAPRLIVPAIYARHSPLLVRLLHARRINDRIYVDWRLPMAVGRLIARLIRAANRHERGV